MGSARNIANVLLLHPERVCGSLLGSISGRALFESLLEG